MVLLLLFFFLEQKTAYEMRIRAWSSDVCSSDLDARAFGKLARILGRELVADSQPGVDRRAMFRIDFAVDRGGEEDAARFLEPREGVAPGRCIRGATRPGDRVQAAARFPTRQGCGAMANRRVASGSTELRRTEE